MADDRPPPDRRPGETKLTVTKRQWAEQGKFLTGKHGQPEADRPELQRLPPGQHLVKNWPVLDLGITPSVTAAQWKLDVRGLVHHQKTFDWTAFQALPQTRVTSDIHCVTTWSRYDNAWTGVLTRDFLDAVEPTEEAYSVMLTGYDGYTTNLLLSDFAAADAIIVTEWEGQPLTREHGGPVRLVVPHLYFWKSAKWLKRIDFVNHDLGGFWEENGYHMRGDPWKEERYGED